MVSHNELTDFPAARLELATYVRQIEEREQALRLAVAFHRGEGVPWSVIGEALGTSKQAAWLRFGP